MKTMSLQEVQSVNLNIMKDIHAFCVEHGIRYSLAYGSLIGAVRHKGFIPWDDDIDIMMPRPDFEVFSRTFVSKQGYTLSSVYDHDTYINYTRVYNNAETLVISPAKAGKNEVGVWVDIYPIDGISDNEDDSKKQFAQIRKYTQQIMALRFLYRKLATGSVYEKAKAFIKFVAFSICKKGSISQWHKKVSMLCKEVNFGETSRCSSLVCMEANRDNRQEVFPTNSFSSYELSPFEKEHFYIVSDYDIVLKVIFGDYMQLPPKEKQVSHVIKKWKFYWI